MSPEDALSVDDAADLLGGFEAEDAVEEIEGGAEDAADLEEITETDDPAVEEGDSEPEEAIAEAEEEEVVEPETAIEAPQFLDQDGKALFAQLPPEAQKLFNQVEQQRNAGVNRKLSEAAEAAKAAQAQAQAYDQRIAGLDGFITEREQALATYEGIDWATEYAQAGADPQQLANVNAHKAQFDQLTQDVQKARQMQSQAEADEMNNSLRQLDAELPQIDPKLADPAERVKAFTEVVDFAVGEGAIERDDAPFITAKQFAIARDAMKWRQAQANAKKTPRTQQDKTGGPALKPGTSARLSTSQKARRQKIASKKQLSQNEAAMLLADLD